MDNIVFYQPSASSSQPPRLPSAATVSIIPGASTASLSVGQTASQLNQQNEILHDQITKSRAVSDLSQKGHSEQRHRNDAIQEQGTRPDLPS
jgi:hypothetical protein